MKQPMDRLFVADPSTDEVRGALELWPELAGKRVRPVLVTAFGDILVETAAGDVWVASPIELTCEPVASSVEELERLFVDQSWAGLRLLTEVALLARDQGIHRPQHQVYGIAPHPVFTGRPAMGLRSSDPPA